jgi:hypothetical protein
MQIIVKLPQHTIRDTAMIQQGLNPKALAMKPGTRVQRDRRAANKKGYIKHKGKVFD